MEYQVLPYYGHILDRLSTLAPIFHYKITKLPSKRQKMLKMKMKKG